MRNSKVKKGSFKDHLEKAEQIVSKWPKWKQEVLKGSSVKNEPFTTELRFENTAIPLKQNYALTELEELFKGCVNYKEPKELQRVLIRHFFFIRKKVARCEEVTQEERAKWYKFCEIVDQRKLSERWARENPEKFICRMVKNVPSVQMILDIDGDEYLVAKPAATKISFLNKGDWFEAKLVFIDDVVEEVQFMSPVFEHEFPSAEEWDQLVEVAKV